MIGIFKPSPDAPRLPADKIDPTYRRLRWQVFCGIFFGYAAYYFVRGNFNLAQKGLIDAGLYNKEQLGQIWNVHQDPAWYHRYRYWPRLRPVQIPDGIYL